MLGLSNRCDQSSLSRLDHPRWQRPPGTREHVTKKKNKKQNYGDLWWMNLCLHFDGEGRDSHRCPPGRRRGSAALIQPDTRKWVCAACGIQHRDAADRAKDATKCLFWAKVGLWRWRIESWRIEHLNHLKCFMFKCLFLGGQHATHTAQIVVHKL